MDDYDKDEMYAQLDFVRNRSNMNLVSWLREYAELVDHSRDAVFLRMAAGALEDLQNRFNAQAKDLQKL